ncbi:YceI family protein [Cellulomonas sp. zg-ZUI199]|uniref:YceI family protein n=1 Tax=Cellulomonas wangleii TaxID=2816956 RepID=A0ABX8D875_9CELL|nr:YceI family protein [Cellulomonas wangleii]MBO0923974.1 YceI family protein [Cellulomonas wangleii]MBO0924256.1 YceI family protein [Cellulomonas wangleii]QVI62267.1 YceI family protein [Cellulomonas wangleii]
MQQRTRTWVGIGAGVVVLGIVAAVVGPGLYADWANDRADAAPTLEAQVQGAPVTATDGTWTVTDGSFAGYRLEEVLRGQDVTVTGRTDQVTGTLTVADGALTAAEVVVDMASIATDQPPRDGYFRDQAIQVVRYPTATFTLTEPVELPQDATSAQLTGDLTIRDVTREVTVDADLAASGDVVQVVGSVPITFADYGVQAPSLGFVTVEDDGFVEFDLRLAAD